ncbi:Zinc metalloproteinase nas-14 [Orchesella cincta]|uniref:Metalloendopeptidase n=1 Tax=Orchesella cincta TaxID=48709 RepID=A0A1D2MPT6_ORCCI|nr:Zinc metalloproteinase nas-14 [Orchesella cincta]
MVQKSVTMAKDQRYNLLYIFTISIITLSKLANCYTCDTSDDWLNVTQLETWPNGVVKYKLHASLTLRDTTEVQNAFEEFHTKTCIRFEPWQEGDLDFVSIEVNNSVCGAANVCKIGGYQVVQFGKDCRSKANIVHQLGHTLCLGDEHQRPDRDLHLNFSSCADDLIPGKIESYGFPMGIYDYASQMHSECGSCQGGWATDGYVEKCGQQISAGLSVLDVDKLNSLYNCQGCQRHRWVPAASLSSRDYPNVKTFGYESRNATPIYVCRAFLREQVTSGMYDESTKTCKLPWGYKAYDVQDQVEVLTIPGGTIGADCSSYQLKNWRDADISSFVNVGTRLTIIDSIHVAYSSFNTGSGEMEKFVGNVRFPTGNLRAEFPVGTEGLITPDYQAQFSGPIGNAAFEYGAVNFKLILATIRLKSFG